MTSNNLTPKFLKRGFVAWCWEEWAGKEIQCCQCLIQFILHCSHSRSFLLIVSTTTGSDFQARKMWHLPGQNCQKWRARAATNRRSAGDTAMVVTRFRCVVRGGWWCKLSSSACSLHARVGRHSARAIGRCFMLLGQRFLLGTQRYAMILDGLGGWTSEGWTWRDVAKGLLGWWWRQVQWTEIGPEDVLREAFGFQDGEFSPRRKSKVSMELRSKSSLME